MYIVIFFNYTVYIQRITAFHYSRSEFESRPWRGVVDKVWYGLFSLGTPVSSTNKTDRHDITEIVLKVALNTINLNLTHYLQICLIWK